MTCVIPAPALALALALHTYLHLSTPIYTYLHQKRPAAMTNHPPTSPLKIAGAHSLTFRSWILELGIWSFPNPPPVPESQIANQKFPPELLVHGRIKMPWLHLP